MLLEVFLNLTISCFIVSIGLLLNGFIVIANMFWWIRCQSLQTVNVLLIGLGLVRIILLSLYLQYIIFFLFGWSLYPFDNPECIETAIMCMVFCGLWWGSLLCVFYCVKITNYNNRLFTRLKMNISKMVPWLLLISMAISFSTSFPFRWSYFSFYILNATSNEKGAIEEVLLDMFIIFFAGSIIPFMICCVAIYLIIVSLVRHTRHLSSRDSGFSDSQRDVHLSVIRSMASFLLFYVLYFVAHVILAITTHSEMYVLNSICFLCTCAYPSLHSISLIVNNKELKDSFRVFFSCTWLGHLK
ncbi:taste receptor type 2 member 39-like [Leptodactylus fuscus]|uniref:taste receptor type 2 member 39-like n=1 Tax=Leptodactylus fuscus TaxID=238119 RepID=UPI003F4F07C5